LSGALAKHLLGWLDRDDRRPPRLIRAGSCPDVDQTGYGAHGVLNGSHPARIGAPADSVAHPDLIVDLRPSQGFTISTRLVGPRAALAAGLPGERDDGGRKRANASRGPKHELDPARWTQDPEPGGCSSSKRSPCCQSGGPPRAVLLHRYRK